MPSVNQIVGGFFVTLVIVAIIVVIMNINKEDEDTSDNDTDSLHYLAYIDCRDNKNRGGDALLNIDGQYKQEWINCRNAL